jgi:hypothetical protein
MNVSLKRACLAVAASAQVSFWHLATRPMTIQATLLGVQRTYRHRAESVDPDPLRSSFAPGDGCHAAKRHLAIIKFSCRRL